MITTPSNIVGRCCTVLNEMDKRVQHLDMLDSSVWDKNLPRIPRKQPAPYWFAQTMARIPIDFRVGSFFRFSQVVLEFFEER